MTCPQDVSASGIRSPFWRAVRFVQNVLASQFCVHWSAQPAELLENCETLASARHVKKG